MNEDTRTSPAKGRRGGRRRAGATTPGPEPAPAVSNRAVGGRLQPLSAEQCTRIHAAVLEILGRIGLEGAPPDMVGTVVDAGGRVNDADRLLFPEALVDRALAGLRHPITLHGRGGRPELELAPGRVHVGTGGAAPSVLDVDTRHYRPSTLRDLQDAARLVDALDNIQFFSRPLVARDLPDERAMDLNTAFACLIGTSKHVMVSAGGPDHVAPIADICYAVAGSEAAFRARPFLSLNVNHVVPPLRFSADACAVMAAGIRAGIPVMVNTFGQLGASSPVTLAGSVAQTMAETLAGMIYAWLLDPEVRAVCGPRPMITDLRTGGLGGGSGEQALSTAMATQMATFYGLPNSTISGATDSKLPDAQSGYEKALSVATAVQSGANMVTMACGMQAGMMGVSFEAYLIDNDMLGAVLRSAGDIEVDQTTLSLASIEDVVRGEGHFLGRPETYSRMKSDFLYPEIADRRSPEEWEAAGAVDILQTARARTVEILAGAQPDHIDPALRRRLISDHDLVAPDRNPDH